MKSKLLSIIYLLLTICVNAQREADILFSGLNTYSIESPDRVSTTLYKFNKDSLEQIDYTCTIATSNFYSGATYSDKYGNFKFTSNGWRLVNSWGDVLAHRLWREDIPWPTNQPDTTNVDKGKGPLFLTDPGDSTKVYLFYGQAKTLQSVNGSLGGYLDVLFTYAYLDINSQQLISKNNVVMTDTSAMTDVSAVRHANGRDWWIIKAGVFSNEYYVGLLDPTGVSMHKKIFTAFTPKPQIYTISHFNEDGTKFLHFTEWASKEVQTFDFDRCTGELSNPIEFDLSNFLRIGEYNNFTISPNGNIVYFQRYIWQDSLEYPPGTFQYDLESGIFYKVSPKSGSNFLAPNFKSIYFLNYNKDSLEVETMSLNEITNPNGQGEACNLQNAKYSLLRIPSFVSHPSYANYRLGALKGSPCDTIRPKLPYAGNTIIYPNPFAYGFKLQLAEAPITPMQLKVYNGVGQIVAESGIIQQTTIITLKEGLAAGLYFVQLFDGQGKLVLKEKMVKNE